MQRRNFLITAIMATPALTFAKFKNKARGKKGIFIKANESRFGGQQKSGDTSAALCKISSVDTGGDLLLIGPGEQSFNAQGGPPLHIHLYQDEIFFVAAGEYLVQVGDEQFHMKEGDTVFAPRQVPHSFIRLTDNPGKLITIFQPAGKMEDFFSQLNALKGMPQRETFRRLFEMHDMKIVGPPLTAP